MWIAVSTACGYFALASLAILLTRLSGGIALLWVANAVLITALLRTEWRLRWIPLGAAFAGSLVASALFSPFPVAAIFFAAANIVEGLIVVLLLRRANIEGDPFATPGTIVTFMVSGGLVAPALSGIVGASMAATSFGGDILSLWVDWVAGHGLGTIITTPLLFLPLASGRRSWTRKGARPLLAGGILVVTALVAIGVFSQNRFPLLFLPVLPILVATFYMGRLGAAVAVAIVGVVAGIASSLGLGPITLIDGTQALRFQFLQLYLAVQFLVALPVAATLRQRDSLMRAVSRTAAALRLLTDNTSDVLVQLDIEGRIAVISKSIRELGGYEPSSLIGRNANTLIDPDWRDGVRDTHLAALATPDRSFTVEYRARKANGEAAWFESRMKAIRDEQSGEVIGAVSAIRDIGHRKALEQRLTIVARTDALTGILNRRGFTEQVQRVLAHLSATSQPAALAIIDADHFKKINDDFGHAAGDAALVHLAHILSGSVGGGDIVGRLGGEEFAILLMSATIDDAIATCERIRTEVQAALIAAADAQPTIRMTVSCGLAPVVAGAPMARIFADADQALYAAKNAGRNRVSLAA